MKILAQYITTTTQIHNGKCYFLGVVGENKTVTVYNIEASGTGAAGNTVAYLHENGSNNFVLPKPGVECSNGLNVAVDGNVCVYYSLS